MAQTAARTHLAQVLCDQGRCQEVVDLLEPWLTIKPVRGEVRTIATGRFLLARAASMRGDRIAARQFAEQAKDTLVVKEALADQELTRKIVALLAAFDGTD